MTVDPGVIIKFQDDLTYGNAADLIVNGRIVANGTADKPIYFTSYRNDTIGGDSNADGNSVPASMDWGGIYLNKDALGLPASSLKNVVINYAGETDEGLRYPLKVSGYTQPTIESVTISSSRRNAIALDMGTYNSDFRLNIVGIPYYIESVYSWSQQDLTVAAGATMTVDPGVIIKFQDDLTYGNAADLIVNGRIVANGTADKPIYFTSYRNDTIGGDSNADGNSVPASMDWGGVWLNSAMVGISIKNTEISYGGESDEGADSGLRVDGGTSLLIENVEFRNNDDAILIYGTGNPDLGGGALGSLGGNKFYNHTVGSGNWAVYNDSTNNIFAYNNVWNYSTTAQIDGIIRDKKDDGTKGEVFYVAYEVCGDLIVWSGHEQCDDGNVVNGDGCDNNCTTTVCGNTIVTIGEDCDDGNTSNNDACKNNCTFNTCGDGIIRTGVEQCDDGNTVNTDACKNNCTTNICGDGAVFAGTEQCDDGNAVNGDGCDNNCTTTGCGNGVVSTGEDCDDTNTVNTDACKNDCTFNTCGDSVIRTGVEQCDDGNSVNTDACKNDCTSNTCGDSVILIGVEQCDDGNTNQNDACKNNCTLNTCGDTVIRTGVEQCDDGNAVNTDACKNDCTNNICGDSVIRTGVEQCDDGNTVNTDACKNDCTNNICGDNVVYTGTEQCDDGNSVNTDACKNDCTFNICGDGIINTGTEECDDGNAVNTDSCKNDCTDNICGDGVLRSVQNVVVDFESGALPGFASNGANPWIIDTVDKHAGTYSLRSKVGLAHNTASEVTFTITTTTQICFYLKGSSENNYDFFRVYVDGTQKFSTSGTTAYITWQQVCISGITAASHVVKFAYSKDSGGVAGSDAYWIDNIVYNSIQGEACEKGSSGWDCCDSTTCQFKPGTAICRDVEGSCDLAEKCTGMSAICPDDAVATISVTCRDSAGECDIAEKCDGTNKTCPADVFKANTVTCRDATGLCDLAEKCTGTTAFCPNDIVADSNTECRVSGGDCDIPEKCDGILKTCPADIKKGSETTCRIAAGDCDLSETCNGTDNNCPFDVLKSDAVTCRNQDGVCDVAENCTGFLPDCPDDKVASTLLECRSVAGNCDIAEFCDGFAKVCGNDSFVTSGIECRKKDGVCDIAENCTGDNAQCPSDDVENNTVICRDSAGVCDKTENCDGVAKECPEDQVLSADIPCRTSVDTCDATEYCTGFDIYCPTENYTTVNGDVCDDNNFETENDICNNGSCVGTLKKGSCDTGISIAALPFEDSGTTESRESHISNYGSDCGSETGVNPDMIYVLSAQKDETYIIVTESSIARVISSCEDYLDCFATGIDFEFTAPETESYIIVVESTEETGGAFTIAVTKKEIVEPDDDVIEFDDDTVIIIDEDTAVEPDDEIFIPDEDVSINDDVILPDEDTIIIPDEDTIVETDDGIFIPDEDMVSQLDDDTVIENDADFDGIDADDETPDELIPTDADLSDSDSNEKPDVIVDSKDNGCGCTIIL